MMVTTTTVLPMMISTPISTASTLTTPITLFLPRLLRPPLPARVPSA